MHRHSYSLDSMIDVERPNLKMIFIVLDVSSLDRTWSKEGLCFQRFRGENTKTCSGNSTAAAIDRTWTSQFRSLRWSQLEGRQLNVGADVIDAHSEKRSTNRIILEVDLVIMRTETIVSRLTGIAVWKIRSSLLGKRRTKRTDLIISMFPTGSLVPLRRWSEGWGATVTTMIDGFLTSLPPVSLCFVDHH